MMRTTLISGAIGLGLAAAGCGTAGEPSGVGETLSSDGTAGGTEPTAGDTTDDGSTATPPEAAVTYHEHLRPLLERHCVQCHQPGNIGPFSMTTFDEVHALREAILFSIEDGTMPPWMPGPGCQDYVGDLSMTDDDVALVRAWLDEGAAEGDPSRYVPPELPPPRTLSRVDLTLQLPEPYLPQQEPDDYRCFLLDWPYEQTTYVTGFDAAPDRLAIVHHMIAFAIPPAQVAEYEALDAAEPGAGYTCFGGPGGEITDAASAGIWLGSWAPGGVAGDFPEGTGIRVAAGSKVALQVHYNTLSGNVEPDQSALDFMVDDEVDEPAVMLLWANPEWLGGDMPIPAGDPAAVHTFELDPTLFMDLITDVIPPFTPFRIHAAAHHMHTLGTSAQQTVRRSDGSETCLLEVPRWDFNWQQSYRFADPVVFNPGDRLRLSCQWNNEAGAQTVNWGDGTQDEMCLGVFYATGL